MDNIGCKKLAQKPTNINNPLQSKENHHKPIAKEDQKGKRIGKI